MNYYQFHIGDYVSNTPHLSPLEDLAYRRLLDLYYQTELPIPADIPRLSRRLRLASEDVQIVLDEFFTLTENGYENDRCNAEIAKYCGFIESQRAKGRKGGRPKKPTAKPRVNNGKADVKPTNTQYPITKNQEPVTKEKEKPSKSARVSKSQQHDQSVSGAVIPDSLNHQVFLDAWAEFCEERKLKSKWMTPNAVKGTLKKLDKAGCPAAVAALNESIANGWVGVFPGGEKQTGTLPQHYVEDESKHDRAAANMKIPERF